MKWHSALVVLVVAAASTSAILAAIYASHDVCRGCTAAWAGYFIIDAIQSFRRKAKTR